MFFLITRRNYTTEVWTNQEIPHCLLHTEDELKYTNFINSTSKNKRQSFSCPAALSLMRKWFPRSQSPSHTPLCYLAALSILKRFLPLVIPLCPVPVSCPLWATQSVPAPVCWCRKGKCSACFLWEDWCMQFCGTASDNPDTTVAMWLSAVFLAGTVKHDIKWSSYLSYLLPSSSKIILSMIC